MRAWDAITAEGNSFCPRSDARRILPFAGNVRPTKSLGAASAVAREADHSGHRIGCDARDSAIDEHLLVGVSMLRRWRGEARCAKRMAGVMPCYAAASVSVRSGASSFPPCLTCVSSPRSAGLLPWAGRKFTSDVCPVQGYGCESGARAKPPSRGIGGGRALSRKRAQNSLLALGQLILFRFRKKRQQADSRDASYPQLPQPQSARRQAVLFPCIPNRAFQACSTLRYFSTAKQHMTRQCACGS